MVMIRWEKKQTSSPNPEFSESKKGQLVLTTVKNKKEKACRYFKANSFHFHPLFSFPPGKNVDFVHISHQWCDHFYRLLYSSTRHTERWKEEKEALN
jgi:hypothetical protein